ncbi:MAG: hypothetical protein ACI4RH_06620 [Huintestinicola sp.]
MRIIVRDDKRIAEIWLTNSEQQDKSVQSVISEKTAEYSEKKYRIAVFRSGNRNLYDCTDGLLHNNCCLGEGA